MLELVVAYGGVGAHPRDLRELLDIRRRDDAVLRRRLAVRRLLHEDRDVVPAAQRFDLVGEGLAVECRLAGALLVGALEAHAEQLGLVEQHVRAVLADLAGLARPHDTVVLRLVACVRDENAVTTPSV